MPMRNWMAAVGVLLAGAASVAADANRPAGAAPSGVVVLDTTGFWRLHHTLRPPVIQMDDGPKPAVMPFSWLNAETPEPPAGWANADFDDSNWVRGPARLAMKSNYLARLCMRGRFEVTDPERVKGLALWVTYQGGVVVHVNGQEVRRANLPAAGAGGAAPAIDSAEAYPLDAYVDASGGLLAGRRLQEMQSNPDKARRWRLRERSVENVPIPAGLLRKGVNVLALEIVRAPIHKVVTEKAVSRTEYYRRSGMIHELCFNTCEFVQAQLTAPRADGLVPNAARPEGLQVWNSNLLSSDYDLDWGDPCEKLVPVFLLGARNGSFSGKFVVGDTRPIEGLKATAGELKGPGGAIPASAIRIRYALPWGTEGGVTGILYGVGDNKHWRYPREPCLLEALDDVPPAVAPVRAKTPGKSDVKTPNQPDPVYGAVVPVWVTVKVPPGAAAGVYEGSLSVEAKGHKAIQVPVRLEVAEYKLPDPQDYRTIVDIVQSPDTLAVEYKADLWSDRHWDLIGKSLSLLHETAARALYVPLIAQTNLGNEQSMVRWIDKSGETRRGEGGGQFDFDFTAMDRYLDEAQKHMGAPKVVVLNVWEVYMIRPEKARVRSAHDEEMRTVRFLQEKKVQIGGGPVVTMKDSAGKFSPAAMPHYDSNAAPKAAWTALFQQLRQRLAARGLEKAMHLGELSDAWPTKEETAFLKEVSGNLPWSSFSHIDVPKFRIHNLADVGFEGTNSVGRYAIEDQKNPLSLFGWRRPELYSLYDRDPQLQQQPITRWRHFTEACITGDMRGMVHIGGDFWDAVRDKTGRRSGTVGDRYPQSTRRNLNLYTSLLAPAPTGPVATTRLEVFREGVMDCEARILLEQAISEEAIKSKLPGDLAERIRKYLEERNRMVFKGLSTLQLSGPHHTYAITWKYFPVVDGNTWYIGSGWQGRTRQLFALAAEVQKALGEK